MEGRTCGTSSRLSLDLAVEVATRLPRHYWPTFKLLCRYTGPSKLHSSLCYALRLSTIESYGSLRASFLRGSGHEQVPLRFPVILLRLDSYHFALFLTSPARLLGEASVCEVTPSTFPRDARYLGSTSPVSGQEGVLAHRYYWLY